MEDHSETQSTGELSRFVISAGIGSVFLGAIIGLTKIVHARTHDALSTGTAFVGGSIASYCALVRLFRQSPVSERRDDGSSR